MKLKSIISYILILFLTLAFSACAEAKSSVKLSANKLTISGGRFNDILRQLSGTVL